MVREKLGSAFHPYTLEQIHGTVVRLDGRLDPQSGSLVNPRFRELTGTARAMDHARAVAILAEHLTPPIPIRIGGLGPGTATMFTSRGRHPHDRAFSLQGDAFVLVGWPVSTVENGIAHQPLDDLRRAMNEANILHLYHDSLADADNDFHLVIGHHNGVPGQEAAEAVHAVRAYLARHPVQLEVGVDQVAIVASNSPGLAPAEFVGRMPVNPADLVGLYLPQA
jgi:hypothetical protein